MKKVLNLLLIPLMVSCVHHQDLKENEEEVQQSSETRLPETTTTDDKTPSITVDYGTPVWTETFKTFVQKIDGKFYVIFRSADSETV